jgi:hypothetical protein
MASDFERDDVKQKFLEIAQFRKASGFLAVILDPAPQS